MDNLEQTSLAVAQTLKAKLQGTTPFHRREFLQGAAAVIGAAALAACGTTPSTGGGGGSTGPKEYTFALIVGVKGDPFYVTMEKGARAAVDKINGGGKVKITLDVDGPAQFDATLQTPIVDAKIAKKVHALIIA